MNTHTRRLNLWTRTLACAMAFMLAATAQQPQTPAAPPDDGAVKFSSTSQLVVETVTVNDKSGKPIEGLTSKDFTITEDGVPQKISVFDFEKLPETQGPPPQPAGPTRGVPVDKLARTQIAPEPPGSNKYQDKRLLSLYFDMTAMPPPDQYRALDAAQNFIRTKLTKADLVSIMQYAGGYVQVLQDFTDDRDKLQTVIETLIVGEGTGLDETTNDASSADSGAAFGQDDSEFNLFNTDRQLAAIQTAAKMLGTLSEKKAMIVFASGIRLNGLDNQAQLHAAINACIRSGVSLWPIDARGLVATAPMGDASRGSPGGSAMYTGGSAMAVNMNFQKSQDTLWALAADTGGKALLDNNDLGTGIVNAQKAISSYYLIGYYTTNQALDGKFRRIKITLNNPEAKIDYRQGYYSNKTFNKFTLADKERQLEDALMLGDPITELTIALELEYFQLNRAEYYIPMIVKIPGRELALARKGGAEHTLIDFVYEVKDDYGATQMNLRDKIDVKLTGSTAAELALKPIEYDTGFTLLPGKYSLKFLARDAETGRIGTYMTKFEIPNLNKEDKRVPISSVVLSSQRVDRKDAIFTVKDKDKGATLAVDPLITDGQKLIPSVTRVFNKNKEMYIYLQAYERGAATTQPLVAFVTFYRGQTKAFETPPLPVTEGMDPKSKAVPLKFSVSLAKLPPGEYNVQVSVLDPGNSKAAFWQAPVMLVQ
ncbi:MAG TPA: VWA domain-containing protein [Bryobacteraceae bacterium]|nr:VWA domain-containing protein [Bryobacteraceae bacterium]